MHTHVGLLRFVGRSIAVAALGAVGAGDSSPAIESVTPPRPHNVLLLLLDDIGADQMGCFPESSPDTRTPRLDAFARSGVRFDNVWSNPACSPTRATILTGRYSFRTGIGAVIPSGDPTSDLAADEVCIPEALRDVAPDCRTALLGKWHLGVSLLGVDAPRVQGFEHFRGTMGNLPGHAPEAGYFGFQEIFDGEVAQRDAYATTATIDDTLAAIDSFGDDPWFVMASFHVAHRPNHAPPAHLHTRELSGKPKDSSYEHVAAMVEAWDTEFGRMLDSLPASTLGNTTIIVVSDNGSPSWARLSKEGDRGGKGSLFEGGIRVPMIVGGPGIVAPGRTVSHPINTADLFATVMDICGSSTDGAPALDDSVIRDSISFAPYLSSPVAPPRRDWILAERFKRNANPNGRGGVDRVAIKLGRYKRIEDTKAGEVRLFDLQEDPEERRNLLRKDAEPSKEALAALAQMASILQDELARKPK